MPYFFTRNLLRIHKVPKKRFVYPPKGLENLPETPYVVVSNHKSSADGYLLGAEMINYIKTKVHFLGMKPRHGGWLMEIVAYLWVEMILVDELNREKAVDDTVRYLEKGDVAILFPEGKTNFDDSKLLKGKTGAARIAIKARVPVVPIGILGGPRLHGFKNCINWFKEHPEKRIQYVVGKPIDLSEYYDQPLDYDVLEEVTRKIMLELGELTNQSYPY